LAYLEGVQLAGGETTLQATVHRADWPDGRTTLLVEANPPLYVHGPVVSSARIGRILVATAGVLSLVGVGLALVGRRRRIRSGRNVAHALTASSTEEADREPRQVVEIS